MNDEPPHELPPTPEPMNSMPPAGGGWWVAWFVLGVLPGLAFPIGAKLQPTGSAEPVLVLVGLVSFLGVLIVSGRLGRTAGMGCLLMVAGVVLMFVSFFVGCASQLRI
jgi:hypothetical protein